MGLRVCLSKLSVDTEHYLQNIRGESPSRDFNIIVRCDNITTSKSSSALVTGDILTMIGRSLKASYLSKPSSQVPQLLNRIMNVHHSMIDLHFALYEIHLELLRRTQQFSGDFKDDQSPRHRLALADDVIDSHGVFDTVVGDAATFYVQIDSEDEGYKFEETKSDESLRKALSAIMTDRQAEIETHNLELLSLAFDDVPYFCSVGNDILRCWLLVTLQLWASSTARARRLRKRMCT